MSNESGVPNINVSSVAITVKSSDSDAESKKTDSDISNDEVPSDVNSEQTVGLLRETKTTADQESQMGILPDTDTEAEPENSSEKNNQENKTKSKSKVLNSGYGSLTLSGAYVSHYNAKGGKFKKTVRQLNSFGIFAKKPAGDENIPKVEINNSNSPAPNVDETSNYNQANVGNEDKATTGETPKINVQDDSTKNNASGDNNAKSNVKIFNAPSNWSHVKSRLFDPNVKTQNTLKTSPNIIRKSKDDGGQNIDDEKIKNGVKIFNAPSDYSHVRSRLFDSSDNESQTNLKPSPRRRSKDEDDENVGENTSGEGDAAEKKRNGVKIFNSSSNYSHVKSRLFDANTNQGNSENLLKPTSNLRRKSKVGIEDDGERSSDELSKRRGSVKIFNAPSNYSHIKSKLFDTDKSTSQQSSQSNSQDNDEAKKQGNDVGQGKENQLSKSRNNVKILNAPSDYSHVRSRLYDSSNKTDNKFKSKVQVNNALKSTNEKKDKNAQNKEASTNL